MRTEYINIWLDDIRPAPQSWVHLRNIEEVKQYVEHNFDTINIGEMSFDYHLSTPPKGIDVMRYLGELCVEHKTRRFWPRQLHYHTNDPAGEEKMRKFAKEIEAKIGE